MSGSGADQRVRYDYDGTRLDKVVDKDTTQKYSYDDFGSVTRVQSSLNAGGTVFPPVNNLPNDLPPACEGQVSGADSGTTLYCFDEFERMVTARGPGLDKETAVYDYDGFDRRDTKLERASGGSDRRRDFAYVGTSRLLSREQSPEGKTMYYDYSAAGEREGQSKAPVGQTEPTVYRSYGTDANGSVEDLEEPDGSVPEGNRYVYDPYGERDTAPGQDGDDGLSDAAKDNPFRFEGFYYDSGVKTYDMQARQYRADTGRFLTQDRYESASGDLNLQADPLTQNRYAFAGGNPTNNIEFDGHTVCNTADQCGGLKNLKHVHRQESRNQRAIQNSGIRREQRRQQRSSNAASVATRSIARQSRPKLVSLSRLVNLFQNLPDEELKPTGDLPHQPDWGDTLERAQELFPVGGGPARTTLARGTLRGGDSLGLGKLRSVLGLGDDAARGTKGGGPRIHSRYKDGRPVHEGQQPARIQGPDSRAQGPHSVLRWDRTNQRVSNQRVYQSREFDIFRNPVRDIDFTRPTFPNGVPRPGHYLPEQHRWAVNDPRIGPRSGFRRGPGEPMP